MCAKYGMGNDYRGLCGDPAGIALDEGSVQKVRMEITPQKTDKVGCRYTTPSSVSVNEVYTDLVPKIEHELGDAATISVGRGTGNRYAWVVCVTPENQNGEDTKQKMYAIAEKIKESYPEWGSSIHVAERIGG